MTYWRMKNDAYDDTTQGRCLRVLETLLNVDISYSKKVFDSDGVDAVTSAMDRHIVDGCILLEGCACLSTIVRGHASAFPEIIKKVGIAAIVSALRKNPSNTTVNAFVCNCLEGMIRFSDKLAAQVETEKGQDTLVNANKRFTEYQGGLDPESLEFSKYEEVIKAARAALRAYHNYALKTLEE